MVDDSDASRGISEIAIETAGTAVITRLPIGLQYPGWLIQYGFDSLARSLTDTFAESKSVQTTLADLVSGKITKNAGQSQLSQYLKAAQNSDACLKQLTGGALTIQAHVHEVLEREWEVWNGTGIGLKLVAHTSN